MLIDKKVGYSAVWILPPADRTRGRSTRQSGNILTCCGLPYGTPLQPNKINTFNYKLKSIKTVKGGTPKNESDYHLKDFFSIYSSSVYVIRDIGSGSTIKLLSVANMTTDTQFTKTDRDVFGANGIATWEDVASTAPIEFIVAGCPSGTITIDVITKGNLCTVTIQDNTGELYKISGDVRKDAEDDYGNSSYIGNKANPEHLIIKCDSGHANMKADGFSLTETITGGLLTDAGTISLTELQAQTKAVIEDCDYYGSFGQTSTDVIKTIRTIAKGKRVISVIDIMGCTTVTEVETYIGSLGFSEFDVVWLWNREEYGYSAGIQNIGLSGWYLGNRVAKNQSALKGIVEDRVNGVGYRDYPIIRQLVKKSSILDDDDKEKLVELRVNATENSRGLTVLGDILSGEKKNTFLKNNAVANGEVFLARAIARLIEDEFGHNITLAKKSLDTFIRILFENAEGMNYFDMDAPFQWAFELTDKEGDTIVCTYCYYPTGAVRKGQVEPMLCAVEAKI